ncbi:MAG: hypothetical protein AAGI07_09025 [Bacteroidota bacterium]
MEDKRFLINFLLITSILTVAVILLSAYTNLIHPYALYIQLYFILLTLISFILIEKGIKSQDVDFVSYFMGASAIRLLCSCIILFLYFYFVKDQAVLFTANFFMFYLCYTVFEIRTLLSKLRQNFDRDDKSDEAYQKNEA